MAAAKKSFVLITGGSGFVGSQTVDNFLRHGYQVRLAGRSASTCDRMKASHSKYSGSVSTVVVPDITVPGAFDEAVKGVDGVIHMASPFTYKIEDNEKDMLIPAVQGTTSVLKSVLNESRIKRIVITSSFAAINDFSQGLRPGHVYDEKDWNPLTYEQVVKGPSGLAYAGSKLFAERAAWDAVSSSTDLSLVTINPVMIYGPPLPGSLSIKHLGQSTSEIYSLMNGTLEDVPPTPMPVFVDVRDIAEAHRLAFETEKTGRYAMSGGSFTKEEVCRLFRDKVGISPTKLPKKGIDEPGNTQHYTVDTTLAKDVLGVKFHAFEDTFTDMAKAFLEMEKDA